MKDYFSWIWRGRYHILTFASVITTLLYIFGIWDYYPDLVSAFLSITGLLIILVLQMLDAKEFADYKPNTIFNWLKSRPTRKPLNIAVSDGILASSAVKARGKISVPSDATIEIKIDFLFQQISIMQDNISNVSDRIDEVESSQLNKLKVLQSDLDKLGESLKIVVVGHIVGAYDINLLGVMMAICGILIQSFSI